MADIKPTIWVHCYKVIDIINKLLATKRGIKEFYKREHDKTKEAWIAALYLIYLMSKDGTDWYIRKNDIQNSIDDIYGRSFHIENGIPKSYKNLKLQIFRLTKYNKSSLLTAIKKKLKADLTNTTLVCLIMRPEFIDWRKINKELAGIKPKLESIGIIGDIGEKIYISGQIYPKISNTIIHLNNLPKQKLPNILEARQVLVPNKAGISKEGEVWLSTKIDVYKL